MGVFAERAGKVTWRFSLPQSVRDTFSLHEDRFGKLWIAYNAIGGSGGILTRIVLKIPNSYHITRAHCCLRL